MQPLDVGCFGPLQRHWQSRCDTVMEETGLSIDRTTLVGHYLDVRKVSFKETTVKGAWERSGLWPVNCSIFTEADFAPSRATSTAAQHPRTLTLPPIDMSSNDFEWTLGIDKEMASGSDTDESDSRSQVGDPTEDAADSDQEETGSAAGSDQTTHVNSPEQSSPSPNNQIINLEIPSPATPISNSRPNAPIYTPPASVGKSLVLGRYGTRTSLADRHDTISNILRRSVSRLTKDELLLRLAAVEGDNEGLAIQLQASETHVGMLTRENKQLRNKLNAKKRNKEDHRLVSVPSRCITGADGLELLRQQDEEAKRKAEKAAELARRREAAKVNEVIRRRDRTEPFKGALSSKKTDELGDIAHFFGIDSTIKTKKALEKAIIEHMEAHPELENNEMFTGLFISRRRARPNTGRRTNVEPHSNSEQNVQVRISNRLIFSFN